MVIFYIFTKFMRFQVFIAFAKCEWLISLLIITTKYNMVWYKSMGRFLTIFQFLNDYCLVRISVSFRKEIIFSSIHCNSYYPIMINPVLFLILLSVVFFLSFLIFYQRSISLAFPCNQVYMLLIFFFAFNTFLLWFLLFSFFFLRFYSHLLSSWIRCSILPC